MQKEFVLPFGIVCNTCIVTVDPAEHMCCGALVASDGRVATKTLYFCGASF